MLNKILINRLELVEVIVLNWFAVVVVTRLNNTFQVTVNLDDGKISRPNNLLRAIFMNW